MAEQRSEEDDGEEEEIDFRFGDKQNNVMILNWYIMNCLHSSAIAIQSFESFKIVWFF